MTKRFSSAVAASSNYYRKLFLISDFIKRAFGLLTPTGGDGLRAQLLRGGIGNLAIKAGHALLAFTIAVVLARTLGAESYGVYSFALAILMLTAIPAQVGVPQLIVRETAKAQVNGSWGVMLGLWRWGTMAVGVSSLAALIVVITIIKFSDVGSDGARVNTLTLGLILIPFMALANVRGASLRGLRMVVQGQLPESIIRPLIQLSLVGLWMVFFIRDRGFTSQHAILSYVVAAIIAFIIGSWLLHRSRPYDLLKRPEPQYHYRTWVKSVMPLAMIAGLQLVNNYADLIILGIFRSDEEVGIYRAVYQVAFLVVFGLQAINNVVMPHFSRLYALGDLKRLQRVVTLSVRLSLVFATPLALGLMIFANTVMVIIFGEDYNSGGGALAILAAGQLIATGIGFGWTILNMCDQEHATFRAVSVGAVINIMLNFMFVPSFGMVGAAVATSLSLIVAKAAGRRSAAKILSLETSFLPPRRSVSDS